MANKDIIEDAEHLNAYLIKDVEAACKNCQADRSQFNRRTVVRTMLASLEAMTFGLKQSILKMAPQSLSPADVALLREETYTLDNKGEVQAQPKFLQLEFNFRYAFNKFAEVFALNMELDCGGKEWRALKEAVKTRNRITHPKSAQACHVSDDDLDNLELGYNWAANSILSCYVKHMQKLVNEQKTERRRAVRVENVDGVQQIRIKLPTWLLASKDELATSKLPTAFYTWTDNESQKLALLAYTDRELAEAAISGTPSLAGAEPFPIYSPDNLREAALSFASGGGEEVYVDRVDDAQYHWAKITVADFVAGLGTIYESEGPSHPECEPTPPKK
jgi:hypothetical protein